MKVPVAMSECSPTVIVSEAGGGGNTNGKEKKPRAHRKPVPSCAPIAKMMNPRRNSRMRASQPSQPQQSATIQSTPASAEMLRGLGGSSVCARQPPHRELDAVAGQHAPALDLGLIGGLGEA